MPNFILKVLDKSDADLFYQGEHLVFGSYEAWSVQNCEYELGSSDRYYIGFYVDGFNEFDIEKERKTPLNITDYSDFVGNFDHYDLAAWAGITTFKDSDLMTIAVLEKYRGFGLAKILVEKLIEKAYELNLRTIFLEVRQSNIGAIKLYEKNGFKKIGLRKNYYKQPTENAVIMECPINKIGVVGSEVV